MVGKTVKASFPSNVERTVASALLLLSSSAASEREYCCSVESLESPGFSASKSEGGSSTAEESGGGESSREQQPLTVVAVMPAYCDLKLKHDWNLLLHNSIDQNTSSPIACFVESSSISQIVQKKRSKSIWISNSKKMKTSNPEPISAPTSSESLSESTTTQVSSSFSSSSSTQSASTETNYANKLTKPAIPGHMGRKAAAILQILSNGSASEVRIRRLLGDSPSTSKALRMLLKQQEVKRSGVGGRADPYIYMIA